MCGNGKDTPTKPSFIQVVAAFTAQVHNNGIVTFKEGSACAGIKWEYRKALIACGEEPVL